MAQFREAHFLLAGGREVLDDALPAVRRSSGYSPVRALLPLASTAGADVYRAMLEIRSCLTAPAEVFRRPGLVERVLDVGRAVTPTRLGPDRQQLLALLR